MILFDNADDPQLELALLFPVGSHGNILITTRNADLMMQGSGENSSYAVGSMLPEDARFALLKAAHIDSPDFTSTLR